jgi:hypothetical protein
VTYESFIALNDFEKGENPAKQWEEFFKILEKEKLSS